MQRVLDRIVPADLIAPRVNLTSPAAGDTLGSCGVRTITWTATDNDQVDEVDLLYSDDSGESWNLIAAALPNPGSYGWSQPGLSGNTFRIKVLARDPGGRQGFDMNAGDFTVELGLPAVAVDSPNGGEAFGEFEPVPVTWAMSDSCSGALDSTRVYISVDGGSAWSYVGTALAPDTSVVWGGTDVPTDSGLVRVMVHDDQGRTGTDIGDGFFSVLDQASPTVTVLAPNGGETAQGGIILSLDADATDNVGVDSVCVSYSTDGGSNWVEIECGAVSFPYSWNTPMVDSDSCLIRVSAWDAAMNTAFDQSDNLFSLFIATAVTPEFIGLTRPVLLQNHPNPMAFTTTTFAFYLPEEAQVTLKIYDISGRLVRTLVDQAVAAGYHKRIWDGVEASGRSAGQGVYFYVMNTPGRQQVRKLVKLR
jgi:hypothetical protein